MSDGKKQKSSFRERAEFKDGELWFLWHSFRCSIMMIRRYIASVTSSIQQNRENYQKDLETRLETASGREAEEIDHQLFEMQYLVDNDFPAFACQTTFVATYSLLEDQMFQLAQLVGQRLGINLKLKELSGNGITKAQVYFAKVCGIAFPEQTHSWQEALHYNQLRNVFAHVRGIVKTTDKDKGVRSFVAGKKDLLFINDHNELHLTMKFCVEVLDNVEDLFGKLVHLCKEKLHGLA